MFESALNCGHVVGAAAVHAAVAANAAFVATVLFQGRPVPVRYNFAITLKTAE